MFCEPYSCVPGSIKHYPFINNNYLPNQNANYKAPESIYSCDICDIKVRSRKILQRHLEGKKHQHAIERHGKTFICDICRVTANGQKQLQIHLKSKRHQLNLDGNEKQPLGPASASKGTWIIFLGIACIFINFLILFKIVL